MKSSAHHSLLPHNTFGIQAKADLFIEYGSIDELRLLIEGGIIGPDKKYIHIGAGANLLFTSDYHGVVIHSAMKSHTIEHESDTEVMIRVENGVVVDDFIDEMVKKGYWGLENLSHIPGETGAAAVQNIGAYGVEFKDVVESVDVVSAINGESFTLSQSDCRYGYRDSIFKHKEGEGLIVTAVRIRLSKQPQRHLGYGNLSSTIATDASQRAVREGVIAVRRKKLPEVGVTGSAGSFFKNPVVSQEKYDALRNQNPAIPSYKTEDGGVKIPAAWLIDKCGLKGHKRGGAEVFAQQPLVIVNNGGATASDIETLAAEVITAVEDRFGITLHPEVIYVR